MIIINIIYITFVAFFALLIGYHLFLSLLAVFSKDKQRFETSEKRKFAIVIPAHNEEKMIAKTIYSLNGLIYPKRLYDIIVVADNCTDETAKIAQNLEATVYERTNKKKKGKGYVLRWIFDRILNSSDNYDGIIVVDSDSLISGNFLEVMNYYLENGSRVIQSSDLVLPQPGNWSVEITRIGFLLYNYVKPLGRKVLSLNTDLKGNGMCFSSQVLKEIPWQAWSLTEDAEYGLILILRGEKIDFAPEAVVWAQMPVEAKNAESQRSRWEQGRFQLAKKYTYRFLKESFKRKSFKMFDTFIDLMTPPFVNTMIGIISLTSLAVILWLLDFTAFYHVLIWTGLLSLGMLYLFIGLYAAKADKNIYKSLIYIPLYALWKIKLLVKNFHKGYELNWVRTTRDT